MEKQELLNSLRNHGFSDVILDSFEKIRREDFIPENIRHLAYEDTALQIGYDQTISQPYTIAFMLDILELHDDISLLEIGSGSGYVLELINEISKDSTIYGIERIYALVERSKKILNENNNINIIHGNGSKGLLKYAPYDRILSSAAFELTPFHLLDQLNPEGILVTPVKDSIIKIKKSKNGLIFEEYSGFLFVPIIEDEKIDEKIHK